MTEGTPAAPAAPPAGGTPPAAPVAPAAPPAGSAGPVIGENGSVTFESNDAYKSFANSDFRNYVNTEYADHSATANITSVNDLIKTTINGQQLIGKDKMAKPGEYSTPEDWAAYHTAGGKPDSVDGYDLQRNTSLPENYVITDDVSKWYGEVALESNLTAQQAKSMWDHIHSRLAGQQEAANTSRAAETQTGMTALKKEYGQAWDPSVKNVVSMMNKFDADGSATNFLNKSGLVNNPTMVKLLMSIASNFAEDTIPGATKSVGSLSPKGAAAKANDMLSDKKHPLHDKKHPEHDKAVEEHWKLRQVAAGGK